MIFKDYHDFLSQAASKYFNLNIEFKLNTDYTPSISFPCQENFILTGKDQNKQIKARYSIYRNMDFSCCGITDFSNLCGYSKKDSKLSALLPALLMIIERRCNNKGAITLTVPYRYKRNGEDIIESYYIKAYKIAQKLLRIFGGTEVKFFNPNTGRDISHITLLTNKLDNFKSLSIVHGPLVPHLFLTEADCNIHKRTNKETFETYYKQLEHIFDQLIK